MTAPEIQQEIERTRERLGETVDELAAKADVKARARAKAAEVKAKATGMMATARCKARGQGQDRRGVRPGEAEPDRAAPLAACGGRRGALIVGSAVIWRRRKT